MVEPALHRAGAEQDLEDEIRFHLEQEAQLRRDRGESVDAAERQARRDFGNIAARSRKPRATCGGAACSASSPATCASGCA